MSKKRIDLSSQIAEATSSTPSTSRGSRTKSRSTSSTEAQTREILVNQNKALKEQVIELKNQAIHLLSPDSIEVTKYANRKEIFFRTEAFHELVEQIQSEGQLIAIGVRPSTNPDFEYQLVYGRRRLEACKQLGIEAKAVIFEADDRDLLIKQFLENRRDDLTYFEESENLILMQEEKFFKTNAELGEALGMSQGKVSQLLSLKSLPQWLKDDYLNLAWETDNGLFEIDIAPLRDVRGVLVKKFKAMSQDDISNLKDRLEQFKDSYLALKNWKQRIDFIVNEEVRIRKDLGSFDVKHNYKFSKGSVGSIKASGESGIAIKINKKFYSKALADKVDHAINAVLDEHFQSKDG